MFITTTTPLSC